MDRFCESIRPFMHLILLLVRPKPSDDGKGLWSIGIFGIRWHLTSCLDVSSLSNILHTAMGAEIQDLLRAMLLF